MICNQITIAELELLCFLSKTRTLNDLETYLQMNRNTVYIKLTRMNKKGLIDIDNPRSPSVVYKTSNKGETLLDQLDNLRFA